MLTFFVVYYLIGIIYVIVSSFVFMKNKDTKQKVIKSWLKTKNAIKSNCNLSVKGVITTLLFLSFAVPVVCLLLITWPLWMVDELLDKKPKQGDV